MDRALELCIYYLCIVQSVVFLLVEYFYWWSISTGVVFLLVEYFYWWSISTGGGRRLQDEFNRVKLKGWEVGGLQALIGTTHFILSKQECDSCHNWAVCVSSNTISA